MSKLMYNIKGKLVKYIIKLKEKEFKIDDKSLSYLLFKSTSNKDRDKLIVVFSGFSSEGNKASYNLVRTLLGNRSNKLYILDNFGFENRGSYYLGENGYFYVSDMVEKLIKKIIYDNNIKRTYFCGSSKGGWASLYFGLKMNASAVISGSPQYKLGNYLSINDKHLNIMNSIMGSNEDLEYQKQYMNSLLKNKIIKKNVDTKIFLHYSINEESYENDVRYLIEDLENNNFIIEKDIALYKEHSQVGYYYPKYLIDVLKKY